MEFLKLERNWESNWLGQFLLHMPGENQLTLERIPAAPKTWPLGARKDGNNNNPYTSARVVQARWWGGRWLPTNKIYPPRAGISCELCKCKLYLSFLLTSFFPGPLSLFKRAYYLSSGLPWWLSGKESFCQCRQMWFDPWSGKIPWKRKWQPTPVFWPRESQGQGSLVDYSPWGRKELDTT